MSFEALKSQYYELRGKHAAGLLSDEDYRAALRELMVQDAQGRFWTIGAESGQWYVSQGDEWVPAEPPSEAMLARRACPHCGAPAQDGDVFCGACGQALTPPPPPTPHVVHPPAPQPAAEGPRRALLIGGLVALVLAFLTCGGLGAYDVLSPGRPISSFVSRLVARTTPTPTPAALVEQPPSPTPTRTPTAEPETPTPTPEPPTSTPTPTATVAPGATAGEMIAQGDALLLQSRFEDAIVQYQTALELDPGNASAYARWARALTYQAFLQERPDLSEGAVAKALTATELDPSSAEAFARLSRAYDWSEQYDKALAAGEKAVELDPTSAEAHAMLAEASFDVDRIEQAETHARRALALDPDQADAHRILAWIAYLDGDEEAVVDELERMTAKEPDLALRHDNLAVWQWELGREEEARASYERAVALYPRSARSLWGLGALAYNRGDYAEALPHFEQAIAINDAFADAYRGLGQCHAALEAHQDALAAFERVVELDPLDADAHAEIAWAHHALGDDDEAQAAAQEALEIAPDHERALALLTALRPPPTAAPAGELVLEINTLRSTYPPGDHPSVTGAVTFDGQPAAGARVCITLLDQGGTQLFDTCDLETGSNGGIPYWPLTYGQEIPSGYVGALTLNGTATYRGVTARDSWTFSYEQGQAEPLSFEEPRWADGVESVPGGYRVTIVIHIEGGVPPFTVRHDVDVFETWERDYGLVFTVAKFPIIKTITVISADGQSVSHDYYVPKP